MIQLTMTFFNGLKHQAKQNDSENNINHINAKLSSDFVPFIQSFNKQFQVTFRSLNRKSIER